MTSAEYQSLRENIHARGGVLVPLEITRSYIVLDGHHRLKAAQELQLTTLPVRIVEPHDETEHIITSALQRRHLTPSQRAALALELSDYQHTTEQAKKRSRQNLRQHHDAEVATLPPRGKTREIAAALANTGERTIQDAATVQTHDPALFEQIKAGEIAAHTAARRVRRALRDETIGPAPAIPTGPFQLIYADPPWQLPGSPDSANAPENHYPTMPVDEIAALEIPLLTTRSCCSGPSTASSPRPST